jgi:hypothetical protein
MPEPLTLNTAVVGTVRQLFGSHRNSQTTLYMFQKYLLCWEREYIVSRNKIDPVKVTFCVFFYNLSLLKNFLHSTSFLCLKATARPCGFYECFWNGQETVGAACAVLPPWPACLFTPAISKIKLSNEDNVVNIGSGQRLRRRTSRPLVIVGRTATTMTELT